ncbi:MAG: hypothetical protein Alpg2KO_34110 [Alphaproteobacteria bacterium]
MEHYDLPPMLTDFLQQGEFARLARGLMSSTDEDNKSVMFNLTQQEITMFHEAGLGLHRLKFEYYVTLNDLFERVWDSSRLAQLPGFRECLNADFRDDDDVALTLDELWDQQQLVRCFEFGSEDDYLVCGVEFDRKTGEVRPVAYLFLNGEEVTGSFEFGAEWNAYEDDDYYRRTHAPVMKLCPDRKRVLSYDFAHIGHVMQPLIDGLHQSLDRMAKA